jgi:hypothetical protein
MIIKMRKLESVGSVEPAREMRSAYTILVGEIKKETFWKN